MKIITQITLLDDTQNENLGDLERLKNILHHIPDKKLIKQLKKMRGNGRNEWPVEAMWNSLIAGFIFNHGSIASLIRELNRNSQLRLICGFQPHFYTQKIKKNGKLEERTGYKLAPTAAAYSNFMKNLKKCREEWMGIFDSLVEYMYDNLDGFGNILAADGKAIQSFATKISSNKKSGARGEKDADWSQKTYSSTKPDGEVIVKTKKWFGFRLHLIADADYELPVDFRVTKASNSEVKELENMIRNRKKGQKEKLERCRYFLADRGYDSTKLIRCLSEEGIAPVIDIRNLWKGDQTRQYKDTSLVYDYKGNVYYVPDRGEMIRLKHCGYDKSRDCHRYKFHPKYKDKRTFRISLSTDPRIFTRVARDTGKWKRLYKKRTSIERINGRIDRDYEFEKHTIRGLEKMTMFLAMTFIVQLASAKTKIESGILTGLAKHCA